MRLKLDSQTCVGPLCPLLARAQEDLAEVHAEGTTGAKNRKLAASANEQGQQPGRGGKRKREAPTVPPDASLGTHPWKVF